MPYLILKYASKYNFDEIKKMIKRKSDYNLNRTY